MFQRESFLYRAEVDESSDSSKTSGGTDDSPEASNNGSESTDNVVKGSFSSGREGAEAGRESGSEAAEATDSGSEGSAEPAPEVSELEETQQKLAETHDRMLRIAAEFENARKRWEKEKDELRQYSIAEFARELLPVIDAFDKAMTSIENTEVKSDTEQGQAFSAIVEGVQLVSKVFHESINKHGIERLPGKGEAFNPEFHNAIAREVDSSVEKETVSEEFVTGYKIGNRVLRTAMVKVITPD